MNVSKRVVVAMSGGVDSSVAAAVLKNDGWEVVGINMRLTDSPPDVQPGRCCAPADIEDARAVANVLDIPFYVLDMRDEFERAVISPFAAQYARGRTPNPCILCNDHMKFKVLLRRARELGAQALATGHYARITHDGDACGRRMVAKARDLAKDQSYFLFSLTHRQLGRIMFPLGDMTKPKARALAEKLGFKVAHKAESQEICFVPEGRYDRVVEQYSEKIPAPGDIVLTDGTVLGKHLGIHRYTIGQRKGLGIAAPRPLYVMELDAKKRRVTVGHKEECAVSAMVVSDITWNETDPPAVGISRSVKIRHQGAELPVKIFPLSKKRFEVKFVSPVDAVTPGQAAVFYLGDTVSGGGWITRSVKIC